MLLSVAVLFPESGSVVYKAPGYRLGVIPIAGTGVQDRIARARLMGDPPDFMICPRLNGFGLFEFHRAKELIPLGQEIAERDIAAFNISGRTAPRSANRALVPAV